MNRGFTLIELLVVIAILAILVGAALPFVQSYVLESRTSKAKSDLEEISRALATYEMREKTYNASDIYQLDGRYLSKAPQDPWGRPYVVATSSGIVYSCGPDRLALSPDDIVQPYLPPLALAQVKWADSNHTGQVDAQNTPDTVLFYFSRVVSATARLNKDPTNADKDFSLTGTNTLNNAFDWKSLVAFGEGRAFKVNLATGVLDAFTPGSDTFTVNTENQIWDSSQFPSPCLASQDVLIQPP